MNQKNEIPKDLIFLDRKDDGFWVIRINASENEQSKITRDFLTAFNSALTEIKSHPNQRGLLIHSMKHDVIKGVETQELLDLKTKEEAQDFAQLFTNTWQNLASLPFPTVAAVSGSCLGCGLDMILACQYRIASFQPGVFHSPSPSSQPYFSFPEIKIGLLPWGGGTQRLAKIVGIQAALDMILTGRRIDGKKALKSGLIDALVPESKLLETAWDFLKHSKSNKPALLSVSTKSIPKWAIEGNPIGRKMMYKKAKEIIESKTKGVYPASFKALDVIFASFDVPLATGYKLENSAFAELLQTSQAQALIHVQQLTQKAKINPFSSSAKKAKKELPQLTGIIGAGQIGGDIATILLSKNYQVRITDPSKEAISLSLRSARNYFQKQIDKRKLSPLDLPIKMSRLSPSMLPTGYDQCELILETSFEDLFLKQTILKSLEDHAEGNWGYAINSTMIPLKDIMVESKHPERIFGLHFFSPLEKSSLVELVVTPQTDLTWASFAFQFAQSLHKHVIVVQDSPGFFTTRLLAIYFAEAINLIIEGHRIDTIDQVMTNFGFSKGPLTLLDEIGLDTCLNIFTYLEKTLSPRLQVSPHFKRLTDSGKLGKKNNRGFYRYINGEAESKDQEVYELLQVKQLDTTSHQKSTIFDQCYFLMLNEACHCLMERVIGDPSDGDLGSLFSIGFPTYWGGIFKYADHVGIPIILDSMRKLASQHGPRFQPSDLLWKYAKENKTFYPRLS